MGTFKITWTPSDNTDWLVDGTTTGSHTWNNFTSQFFLDGSITPLPNGVWDLPVGFHILTAAISVNAQVLINGGFIAIGGTQSDIESGILTYDSGFNPGSLTFLSGAPLPKSYTIPVFFLSVVFELFTINMFIDNTLNAPGTSVGEGSVNVFTNGTYEIISSAWVLENLTYPNDNGVFRPGDRAKLHSTDDSYDFTTIDEIHIVRPGLDEIIILSPEFIIWVTLEIEFDIPDDAVTTDIDTNGVTTISGTQFDGTAVLGPIVIIIANSSGIYKITTNKRNDTLYLNSSESAETLDNKIPDAFIRTGFIGG